MGHYIQAITVPWYNACADYAVMLALGLKRIGHRVTVVGGEGAPALERAKEYQLEVAAFPGSSRKNPFSIVTLAHEYRKYIRENQVTVVNAHHGRDHLGWAVALRNTGIPLVRTSGNQIPPNTHPGARYLLRKHTAGIVASCATVQRYYTDGFGLDPETVPVLNGGVDCSYFTPGHPRNSVRAPLGIPDDAFLFGIIGRFSPVKGHRFFFEAARRISRIFPNVRFVIAGWDAQLTGKDMLSLAQEAGIIERTRITGRQNDIRDLIASLDAGIIASVGSETVCRIAMEYMAMGVPVIAADTNVIPEVIRHARTGLIVPKADPTAMAAAMERLAASPDYARSLGEAGRTIAEQEFSLERFALKTLEAYRSIGIHA